MTSNQMNIAIIDTHYVGLVTGACLAVLSNNVFWIGESQTHVDLLNRKQGNLKNLS